MFLAVSFDSLDPTYLNFSSYPCRAASLPTALKIHSRPCWEFTMRAGAACQTTDYTLLCTRLSLLVFMSSIVSCRRMYLFFNPFSFFVSLSYYWLLHFKVRHQNAFHHLFPISAQMLYLAHVKTQIDLNCTTVLKELFVYRCRRCLPQAFCLCNYLS